MKSSLNIDQLSSKRSLNINGYLFEYDKPQVMGILNMTPDSFYDGGKFNNLDNITFSLKKNDLLVQKGNSNLMIYNIEYLIEYISKFITLEKGDLIFSGTPKGVGKVEIGDKLEGFINDEKLLDIIII